MFRDHPAHASRGGQSILRAGQLRASASGGLALNWGLRSGWPSARGGTRLATITLCDWQRRFLMTRLVLVSAALMPRVLDRRRTLRIGGARPYKAEDCF